MQDVYRQVKQASDPDRLTEVERLHVPVVESPDTVAAGELFPVTIKVGVRPHVVKPGHFIQFVDLYVDQTFVSRLTLTPTVVYPKVTHYVRLSATAALRVVAFCNQHGYWETSARVTVMGEAR